MADDKHENKSMKNIKVLRSFRVQGEALPIGAVIPKAAFAKKGDWQNLCHMEPPKAEETSDPIGLPAADDEVEELTPGQKAAATKAAKKAAKEAEEAAKAAVATGGGGMPNPGAGGS